MLAGVSTDYYARLERGRRTGVSNSVLEAVAEALHLAEAERGHPCDLARVANTTPRTRRTTGQQVRDGGGSSAPVWNFWQPTGSGTPLATPNQFGDPRLRLVDIPRVGG